MAPVRFYEVRTTSNHSMRGLKVVLGENLRKLCSFY